MGVVRLLPRSTVSGPIRAGLVVLAAGRFARGARRSAPLRPGPRWAGAGQVTVVVPARDEARRVGPCVRSLVGQGARVLVVDDGSSDDTAAVARAGGAEVITAGVLPPGWAGKARALQVGLEAATTPVVIAVDADCRVEAGFMAAMAAALGDHVLVSAGTGVDVHTVGAQAVHASMLATLVYRFGPPGVRARRPSRTMANGQCMAFDRASVLAAGGFAAVAASLTEDLALARHLASTGARVAFTDATGLVTVEGYGSARDTLGGWGRSLALAEVTSWPWLVLDLAVVWSAMAAPLPRLLARRGDIVDVVAIAVRAGVAVATAGVFRRGRLGVVIAPLADPLVAARLTVGAIRPSRRWRGRDYA